MRLNLWVFAKTADKELFYHNQTLVPDVHVAWHLKRYTYRVLQTIQMKLIFLCVWTEPVVLGSTKIALKFKYVT